MAVKSARYEMRMDPDKLDACKRAAREAGLTLPEWIERAADRELRRQEREKRRGK